MSWTDVILAWLFTRAGGRGAERELQRAFPELRGLDTRLADLSARELVERRGASVLLTKAGLEAAKSALGSLGVKAGAKRFSRDYLRQVALPAKALGLDPEGLTRDDLKAALVARATGKVHKSLGRARDALLWKELGIDSDQRFTLKAVSLALLGRRLGRPVTDVQRALDLVASAELGTPGELRAALRSRFLASLPEEAPVDSLASMELADFARAVLAAGEACTTRFGPDRVYISALFQQLDDSSLPFDAFKRRLLEASQTSAIRLARADLVEAMPADLVLASETRGAAGSTFHFVVLPSR